MTAPSAIFGTAPVSPLVSPVPSFLRLETSDPQTLLAADALSRGLSEERFYIAGDEKEDEDESTTTQEEPSRIKINKDLLIYKAFYFLFYGAVGSLFPYLVVFYKQLYLSAQQVGFLIGIRPFIQMSTGPLWGALADTYNVKKAILLMSIGAWLATNYSISIVRVPPETACNTNFSMIRLPEIGKISETPKLGNASSVSLDRDVSIKSFLKAENMPLHRNITSVFKEGINAANLEEKMKKLRMKRAINTEEIYLILFARLSRTKRNSSKHRHTDLYRKRKRLRNQMKKLVTVIYSRLPRSMDYVTSMQNHVWGKVNTTSKERPLQRILAADELEEEFDSLNTDDEYPWPLDNIETEEQGESLEAIKNALNIFIVLIIITVVGTVLASPAATFADTATLEILGENTYQYGYQRLWGAFGWGLCAFIVGAVVSGIQNTNCEKGRHVDYILSFYVYAAMMALAFLCAVFFKFSPVENETAYTESLWEAIKMFNDCQHACFVLTLLSTGAAMGFTHTFLFWHLHDIGGTQFLFSVISAVQCISEVLMYLMVGYLLLHLECDNVLYIGLLSNVVRLFAYSVITQPIYSIPLEILQGISSASIWTAAICYIGLIPGTPVTLQALLHGIYWGLGHGGGGIIGGVLVSYIGSNATFIAYGTVCFVNFVILVILKYRSKILEVLGNYTYVENIPAGTYILTTVSQIHHEEQEERESR